MTISPRRNASDQLIQEHRHPVIDLRFGGGGSADRSEPPAEFVTDLAGRLRHRVQLTTDGHRPYLEAVEAAFGMEIDYATLTKTLRC